MLEKHFNPKTVEQDLYRRWESSGAFAANPQSNAAPFTVMMPPPNVTGSLHMGHALNMTLQDVLIRYNRMRGRDALWQPGTDHASIVVDMLITREFAEKGLEKKDVGREAFIERCWSWKNDSGSRITTQLRRLGASPDWRRERFTMDTAFNDAVTKVFVQLYREGLIYKDKRLVNWDPKFHSSVSDLEVEQKEQKGHLWHIRYPVEGAQEEFITIATTRPETMLGDTAIAVHPDDERYKHMIGQFASVPIVNRLIPIIADHYVDMEQGSGAVKITPAHDFNDFEIGKRHNLPQIAIFDINACCNENTPEEYQGLDRYKARKKLLAELEELDLIAKVDDIRHVVPHGDRSGEVIEPMLTDQWYCDAKTLAQPALRAVEEGRTVFVPKTWENTYFEWMRNIQPWCISRQLWWGHQIPAWYGPDGKVFVAETEQEAYFIAKKYYDENNSPSQGEGVGGGGTVLLNQAENTLTLPSPSGRGFTLTQDPDVLDTWFSSALWPFSTLGWPDRTPELARYYPGDVLVTGFDIIFFWVARMMMMGLHFMKDVPFRTIYMHALVRDAKGQKMSKSKGNVMDPLDLIDEYGADALRFTMTAMAAPGRDIKLAKDRVEGYRNFTTKLWNAARYCEMNGCSFHPEFDPAKVQSALNRWIIAALAQTKTEMEQAFAQYRFNDAAGAIYQFVWGIFCDWYLEFSKPLLMHDGPAAAETKNTIGWVLRQILVLLNPIMPFITEELAGEALIAQSWPDYSGIASDKAASDEIGWLIRCISEIRSVRADMNVPASAKTQLLLKDASNITKTRLQTHEEILKRMARIETIGYVDAIPAGAIQTVLDEATLLIPVAGLIDLEKERARLQKEVEAIKSDLAKTVQKLENADFVARAPEEVLTEHKERKISCETKLRKLTQALAQMI